MIDRRVVLPLLVVFASFASACGDDSDVSPAPTGGGSSGAPAGGNGGTTGKGGTAGNAAKGGSSSAGAGGKAAAGNTAGGNTAAGNTGAGNTGAGNTAAGSSVGGTTSGGSAGATTGGANGGGANGGGANAGGSSTGGAAGASKGGASSGGASAGGKSGSAGTSGSGGSAAGKAGASGTGTGGTNAAGQGSAPAGNDDPLTSLPADSGGKHTPHPLGTTDAKYGYYLYTPGGYEGGTKSYPLLVFLHGKGERGNGVSDLPKVTNQGVPDLIKDGKWAPKYPMLVASPQYEPPDGKGNDNNWGEGDPSRLRGFIEHVMGTYRVNPERIYLTGLSHGGNGVYDYLTQQEDETSHIAAIAVVAAYGPGKGFAKANNTPIWVFVGANDGANVSTSKKFVEGYNAQVPPPTYPARISVFPNAGHDVWTRTYDLSGMGTADPAYDPYDIGVFDWMFQYKRTP